MANRPVVRSVILTGFAFGLLMIAGGLVGGGLMDVAWQLRGSNGYLATVAADTSRLAAVWLWFSACAAGYRAARTSGYAMGGFLAGAIAGMMSGIAMGAIYACILLFGPNSWQPFTYPQLSSAPPSRAPGLLFVGTLAFYWLIGMVGGSLLGWASLHSDEARRRLRRRFVGGDAESR